MDRSQYYGRGMNIDLVHAAEALTDAAFQKWVSQGANPKSTILQQQIETAYRQSRTGQIPPSATVVSILGKAPVTTKENPHFPEFGDFGLKLQPHRQPTKYDMDAADEALNKFFNRYQQCPRSDENLIKIANFLASRGAICNEGNLKICFEQLWGSLTLRDFERVRVEPEVVKQVDGNAQRRHQLFVRNGIPIPPAKPKSKAKHAPVVNATSGVAQWQSVVKTYSPEQVARMSADQQAKFMQPMKMQGLITEENMSAQEFYDSTPELHTDEKPYLLRKRFWNEWERFTKTDTGRGWVEQIKKYGLEKDACNWILGYLERNNLDPNEVNFRLAAEATLEHISVPIPDTGTSQHGVSVYHDNQGNRSDQVPMGPYGGMAGNVPVGSTSETKEYSQNEVRRLIRVLDSGEYLKLLNDSPAFRAAVTEYLGS